MNADQSSVAFEALIETLEEMNATHLAQIRVAVREGAAAGVKDGLTASLSDDALQEKFWRSGFDRVSKLGGEQASQWVGKRILTALLVALLGFTVAWLAKLGVFK